MTEVESLAAAEARHAAARRVFIEAASDSEEAEAAAAMEATAAAVELAKLRVEKRRLREQAEFAAQASEAAARRAARVIELKNARAGVLAGLSASFEQLLTARRAFAAAVQGVMAAVEADAQRVGELNELGYLDHAIDLDVARLAVTDLIDQESPASPAPRGDVPQSVLSLAAGLVNTNTTIEAAIGTLRNEFVAHMGPTVADFCCAQQLHLHEAPTLHSRNSHLAFSLLTELESLRKP